MSQGPLERVADGIERLSRIGGWIAAAAVFGILVLVAVEIILRSVFGLSTQISDEMSGYLNVAIIYFGLALALKDGTYVRVEPLFNRLKGRAGLVVRWFIVAVSLVYMVVATWMMARYAAYSFRAGLASTSYSETPLWIPQAVVVVGSALLVLQLVAFLLRGGRTVP
ncbi:MAG: TRAP transporter small permease subunit [Acetobacteraceae bacterium]